MYRSCKDLKTMCLFVHKRKGGKKPGFGWGFFVWWRVFLVVVVVFFSSEHSKLKRKTIYASVKS